VLDREAVPVPTYRGLIRFEQVLDTEIRVLALPRGKDPDEVVLEDPEGWNKLVAQAMPVVDFYFNAVSSRLDLRNPRDKAAAVDRLLPIIGEVVDDVVRSHYLQKLGALVQVDERTLSSRLRGMRQPAAGKRAPALAQPAVRPPAARTTLDDYSLAHLLYEPALFWRIQELAPDLDDFPGTENRQIFIAFQSFMQANSAFDLPAFRQTLDPTLYQHLDVLLRMGTQQPLATGEELENSLIVTLLRGRKQHLNNAITQMTYLLREAKQEDNQIEIVNLTNRVHALSEELGHIGRQLNDRTVLWRTRGET